MPQCGSRNVDLDSRRGTSMLAIGVFCVSLFESGQCTQVSDRPAGCDALGCCDNGVGVNAIVTIEVGERAGLPKVLDAQRAHAMTEDCAAAALAHALAARRSNRH